MAVELRVKKNDEWITLDPPENGFKIKYEKVNSVFDLKTIGRTNTLTFDIPLTPQNKITFDFQNIIELASHEGINDLDIIFIWNGIVINEGILKSTKKIGKEGISVYLLFDNRLFKEKLVKEFEPYTTEFPADNNPANLDPLYERYANNSGASAYYYPFVPEEKFCFPYMQSLEEQDNFLTQNINYYSYGSSNYNEMGIMCHFVCTALRNMFNQYFENAGDFIHGEFFDDLELRDLIFINTNFFNKVSPTPPFVKVATLYELDFEATLQYLIETFCLDVTFVAAKTYPTSTYTPGPYTPVYYPSVDITTNTLRLDFIKTKLKNRKVYNFTDKFLPSDELETLNEGDYEIEGEYEESVILDIAPHANQFKGPQISVAPIPAIEDASAPDKKLSFFRGLQLANTTGVSLIYPMCSHDNLDIHNTVIGNYSLVPDGEYGLKENFWKDYNKLRTKNIKSPKHAWLNSVDVQLLEEIINNNHLIEVDRVQYFIAEYSGNLRNEETALFTFELVKNNL